MSLCVVPITLREAASFVLKHHRHTKPPRAMKFAIGLVDIERPALADQGGAAPMVGVAVTARPSARELDDGRTIEANSKLYGAAWRAARAMGYRKGITYTEEGESGVSLKAAGWKPVATLPTRGDWQECAGQLLVSKYPQPPLFDDLHQSGQRARVRWEITA